MAISFEAIDILPTDADLDLLQQRFGFKLPEIVRDHFLKNNGGVPNPHVFILDHFIATEVACSLSVITNSGGTLVGDVYGRFVSNGWIAEGLLPFAVDAGGDYFFVDCRSDRLDTYFYDTQVRTEGPGLVDLERGFLDFWETLSSE